MKKRELLDNFDGCNQGVTLGENVRESLNDFDGCDQGTSLSKFSHRNSVASELIRHRDSVASLS